MRFRTLPLVACLLLLAACDWLPGMASTADGTPTPPPGTPTAATAEPVSTPVETLPVTATVAFQPSLIVWIPPEIAARTEASGELLATHLAAAATDYPDLQLSVEQKAVSGQGGILSYLRTGRNVAPSILPDLVILRNDQLATALNENLVYPIQDYLDPNLLEDLFPAARAFVEVNDQVLGYPLALTGLTQLAWAGDSDADSLPPVWDQLTALSGETMLLPAAGREGAVLGLQLYLGAGGRLVDADGQTDLQLSPLTTALERLSRARQSGFILPQSGNLTSLADTWQLFANGGATMVLTTSDQVLLEQPGDAVRYAPVPGYTVRLTPLAGGWSWAVTAPEPAQQQLAVAVISQVSTAANMAEWTYQSRILPPRRTALQLWPAEDPYLPFVLRELDLADPLPAAASNNLVSIIGNAVFDVVSLTKSPQIAAEEAITALEQ